MHISAADQWRCLQVFTLTAIILTGCGRGGASAGDIDAGGGDPPPLVWYLIIAPTTTVDGRTVTPIDVLGYTPGTDSITPFTTLDLTPGRIDAFERVDDDTYHFSVDRHARVDGIAIAPGDIALHEAGTVTLAFDAGAAGLPDGVNINALTRDGNGDFIFATDTRFTVNGRTFGAADLVRHHGGKLSRYRDGSRLGLDKGADINAVTVRANGDLALSLRTGGIANGLPYAKGDVLLATRAAKVTTVALETDAALSSRTDVAALSDNR